MEWQSENADGKNFILEKQNSLDNINYEVLLRSLKLCSPVRNLSLQQIGNLIDNVDLIFRDTSIPHSVFVQIFRVLRNLCTRGSNVQQKIAAMAQFFGIVTHLIKSPDVNSELELVVFQCLANLCVQNNETQRPTWENARDLLIENVSSNSECHNVAAMILYNMFIDDANAFVYDYDGVLFKELISIMFDQNLIGDTEQEFVNLFIEHFLVKYDRFVELYEGLDIEYRLSTLKYCIELVKADDHIRCLNQKLVVFLLDDFKKKSDLILIVTAAANSHPEPREIILLLELITCLSSSNLYTWILHNDKSLFLNIGCLLVSINDLGKVGDNIFTPSPKLEQFVTSRDSTKSLEQDISYEFKTMLVRCIANLSHKNVTNQNLARDVNILLTILECTNMDAKNPLIKEWSILAIRNLCENNLENQNLIKSLTKVGDSLSSIVVDDGRTENGSIRIKLN